MVSERLKPIGGTRIRITKLDECGIPLTGPGSCSVVTKGFVTVNRTAQFAEPDEHQLKNADGELILAERSAPELLWYQLEITFAEVDPAVINLLTGNPLVMDDSATPKAVGYRTKAGAAVNAHFALELWSRAGGEGACAPGGRKYGYYLLPWVTEGVIGDLAVENAPVSFVITQARTRLGGGWGVGPYDVLNLSDGSPSPLLTPIAPDEHDHWQVTTLAPPEPTDGCVEL